MTKKTKKNSAMKKLIPAIGMLAVSGMMLASSTYAWFTMNKEVTVTGMQVHTTVDSNLQIAETNLEANYQNSLTQNRQALLEPASSINGIDYYWTAVSNVQGNGDAIAETYTKYNESTAVAQAAAGKTAYDAAFSTNYGKTVAEGATLDYTNVAYGYIDYTFYLKAVNTDAAQAKDIVLSELTFKYNNGTVSDKAWRVALISHAAVKDTAYDTAFASGDVVSIFTLNGADTNNQTSNNYAVGLASTEGASPAVQALSYGNGKSAYNQSGTVGSVSAGATAYYKVDVRLWLEGEDKDCTTSTYATLKENYTLDLKFCFDDSHSAVSYIQTPAAAGGNDGGDQQQP
jgi:hypothetical protein